ncbi:hypothetical protein [Bartonella sp. B39]
MKKNLEPLSLFNSLVPALKRDVATEDTWTGNKQPRLYDKVQIEKLIYLLQSPNKYCMNAQEAECQLIDSYNELLSLMFFIQVRGYTAL